jgi:phosphoenolpyruvate carboxykinase (ATP)
MSVPKTKILNSPLSTYVNMFTNIRHQLSAEALIEDTLAKHEGVIADNGALCIQTGAFTGRSPKDKFIVLDETTKNKVDWNDFNIPIEEHYFFKVRDLVIEYLAKRDKIWSRHCFVCADINYRVAVTIYNEKPSINLFAYNMFIRPTEAELKNFATNWTILSAPGLRLDPAVSGTRQHNAAIISFKHKTVLIAGTGYTGETKKGIFTILNYILPLEKNVLSMHCAANIGAQGDTAIFFGLSGTGKTTLSTDPKRKLIGDDEHGWSDAGVFNFEGGCYAKTIGLSKEKEPEIYKAIRKGALLENISFVAGTNTPDYNNGSVTENTRVSYPIEYIDNIAIPSVCNNPNHIFFLTCDAAGVLPPVSKLSPEQAMYQFISGYTAKVAGTEAGVTEPKSTFSACFGAPFLPLHPGTYAAMLGEKIKKHEVAIWLINTGWTGGSYGIGNRISLKHTRAIITAVIENKLDDVMYETDKIFGFNMPTGCPNVPSEILNPRNTWQDKDAYDVKAKQLAQLFITNFEKYKTGVDANIIAAGPSI